MATIMLLIAIPYQPLLAAMVPTEATVYQFKAQDARDHMKTLISRNHIKTALISQGIDPDEAKARVDSLSDSEVIEVADKIEQLPAGGGVFGAIIGAALIVFLVSRLSRKLQLAKKMAGIYWLLGSKNSHGLFNCL
jgi:hypothetical protein